jgi:hypothetical protein
MRTLRAQLESTIERDTCRDALQLYGIRSSKLVTPGDTGWPDHLFWIPGGKPTLIEFKREGEEPEPKQEYIHEVLRGLKYEVHVCDTKEEALTIIRQALEAAGVSKTLN